MACQGQILRSKRNVSVLVHELQTIISFTSYNFILTDHSYILPLACVCMPFYEHIVEWKYITSFKI